MSAPARQFWKGLALAVGLWLVALLCLEGLGLAAPEGVLWRDGDSLRHIATGDLMRELGTATPIDPWSHATEGQPWYNPSWLFNLGLSALHQFGGFWGVTLAATGAAMLALALPVLVATAHGARFPLAVAVAMATGPLLLAGTAVRPQMVTLLLIPLTVALLWRAQERGRVGRIETAGLWLILLIWVNAHGGWPVYFTLVGFWLGAALLRLIKGAAGYAWILLLSFPVACLNPLGPEAFLKIFDFFNQQPLTGAINEWQAFDPIAHWIFLPGIGLFVLEVLSRFRLAWKSPLVWAALFWLLMSLGSVRHLHVFAPLGLMATAWLLAGPTTPLRTALLERLPPLPWRTQALAAVPALVLALAALPWCWRGVVLSDAYTLTPEAAYLKEHHPTRQVFNAYNYGGALAFALRGQPPIWIDDRAETLYSRKQQEMAIAVVQRPGQAPQLALRAASDVAIFPKKSRAAAAFEADPGWQRVFTGPSAAIFLRRLCSGS